MSKYRNESTIIVISGPSGVGKGTIIQQLCKRIAAELSVSHTTRYMREGEKDGVHYHFVTVEEFRRLEDAGQMIESAEFSGNYYGTSCAAVDDVRHKGLDVILDIEYKGAANVRRIYPEAVEIFILPPSLETLEQRLRGRGTEPEAVIQRRLNRAKEDLAHAVEFDYLVVNHTVAQAVEDILKVLSAAKLRTAARSELVQDLLDGAEI